MKISNHVLLRINLAFIVIQLIGVILAKYKVLVLEYGWEGREKLIAFAVIIANQILFIFLISKLENQENQKRMYVGHLILIAIVGIWLATTLEIYH